MSGERSPYIAESPKQQGLGPLADRLRNSRTVAGFVSKPCETATTNNAETLSTERVKSWSSFQSLWRTATKWPTSKTITSHFRNSRTVAGFVSEPCETATTHNAEMLPPKRIKSWMSFQNLWRAAMKCQTSKTSVQSLWRTACETAEQQQDSCPNHAKQRPRTMPKRCLRNAWKAEVASKAFGGRLWNVKHPKLASKAFGQPLPKQPNSSRIRASQSVSQSVSRSVSQSVSQSVTAMKCQTSRTSVQSLWRTACETAEQQQDSCLNHAKQRPRTKPKCCLRNALRAEWASKTFGGPLWNVKHQKLASQAFGEPQQNESKP